MSETAEKYLIFMVADTLYSFALSQVSEIRERSPLWPIPAAPSCFEGAMNHHGSIVAVLRLSGLLKTAPEARPGKMIVLHESVAALAFPVEDVVRIVPGSQATIQKIETESPFALGRVLFPGGTATLLDAAAISAYASELMASAS